MRKLHQGWLHLTTYTCMQYNLIIMKVLQPLFFIVKIAQKLNNTTSGEQNLTRDWRFCNVRLYYLLIRSETLKETLTRTDPLFCHLCKYNLLILSQSPRRFSYPTAIALTSTPSMRPPKMSTLALSGLHLQFCPCSWPRSLPSEWCFWFRAHWIRPPRIQHWGPQYYPIQ